MKKQVTLSEVVFSTRNLCVRGPGRNAGRWSSDLASKGSRACPWITRTSLKRCMGTLHERELRRKVHWWCLRGLGSQRGGTPQGCRTSEPRIAGSRRTLNKGSLLARAELCGNKTRPSCSTRLESATPGAFPAPSCFDGPPWVWTAASRLTAWRSLRK